MNGASFCYLVWSLGVKLWGPHFYSKMANNLLAKLLTRETSVTLVTLV